MGARRSGYVPTRTSGMTYGSAAWDLDYQQHVIQVRVTQCGRLEPTLTNLLGQRWQTNSVSVTHTGRFIIFDPE